MGCRVHWAAIGIVGIPGWESGRCIDCCSRPWKAEARTIVVAVVVVVVVVVVAAAVVAAAGVGIAEMGEAHWGHQRLSDDASDSCRRKKACRSRN